jgi:hypothetical protein
MKLWVDNEICENRNDPDLVQAFLKKWWVESDFKAPNLPLSLRLKIGKIVVKAVPNPVKQMSTQHLMTLRKCMLVQINLFTMTSVIMKTRLYRTYYSSLSTLNHTTDLVTLRLVYNRFHVWHAKEIE